MKVRSTENIIVNNRMPKTQKNGLQNFSVQKNNSMSQVVGTPSFKGMDPTTCLIDFWAAVARGGLAASFTVQDMLGTNFPRTFAALDRNKDITGKNNYKAAVEVAIREFTTGPSMFIIPALVLAGASRMSGTANRVPTDNISAFSDIMKGTLDNLNQGEFKNGFKNMNAKEAKEACNTIKKAFYKDVFTDIFDNYTKGETPVNIDEYVKLMMQAEDSNTPKRNFFQSMFNKRVSVLGKEVDSKDEILAKLSSKFVADKKARTTEWGNFLTAKVGNKEFKIDDIVVDMKNYSDDFAKEYIAAQRKDIKSTGRMIVGKFVDNFKDKRIATRFITNVAMVVATGLFMCIIPKLYTRNETNPETDAIYAQVNQQRKGAVNENK